MATRQASVEKKRASAKDRLAKHREKIYSNPVLLEEYRRKERERYRKRKENGKIKTTQDLTNRQHERKKIKWRKNSAKYYRKKKQEQALLDLTPASSLREAENSFANEENNRQELDTNNENLNRTPAEESLDLTGPMEASTPQRTRPVIKKREGASKTVAKLRAKLRYAEERLVQKNGLHLQVKRGTRDAACQTESAGVLHIETNPSRRSKALQVRVPDHSVYCSTDDLEVVGSKPTKRWRHYDTESSGGSPPHLPLPDDITDWHANSESLWSGAELRVTDSPSSQADGGAWVKVTVKNEGEGEDIPLAGGRQEENEEQEDRKPLVSSAAGPLSNVSALSETPSPCPRSLGPGKKNVKEEETETTVKDEETLAVGGDSGTP